MYVDERYLRLHVFDEEAWHGKNGAKAASTCAEKVKKAVGIEEVIFSELPNLPNQWTAFSRLTLDTSRHGGIESFWYVTLDDCALELNYVPQKDAPEIDYKYEVYSVEKIGRGFGQRTEQKRRHLGADQKGMSTILLFSAIVSFILFCISCHQVQLDLSNYQHGSNRTTTIHIALPLTALACLCNAISCLAERTHLSVYDNDGIGSYSLDCLAAHLEAMSDATVEALLLAVGNGWTLPNDVLFSSFSSQSSLRASSESFINTIIRQRNVIIYLGLLILHAILAQWGRTLDLDFDAYHALDTTPGRFLSNLRIILSILFLLCVTRVRNDGRCPPKLKSFLGTFAAVGGMYLISMPILGPMARILAFLFRKGRTDRHKMLAALTNMGQLGALGGVVWLFAGGGGDSGNGVDSGGTTAYHKVSRVSAHRGTDGDHDGFTDVLLSDDVSSPTKGGGDNSGSKGGNNLSSTRTWFGRKIKIRMD